MLTFAQIIGGIIGVIVAGLPAMVALLKIKELHIAVNSALAAMILATKVETTSRIDATKLEADSRFAELKQQMEAVNLRNEQLLDQLTETVKCLPVIVPNEQPPC